ncbi:chaperonin-like RBCX protein 1, chloroplastic isoform X1 [Phragmites australis]|uniref:chaperonin-like RBCX protein 1, chloroplastic isoform X1 n=1 Tax=Phragmites australis TaxID=29695 RepID=UPI002D770845|nr:chaperonin-like RBCX protein 1, chloroplastic isoform X1 [Phragmites australis]
MECSVVLPLHGAGVGVRPRVLPTQAFWGTERRRRRRVSSFVAPARCSKMYVPGFGEGSPEKKAATNLQHFFNYVAVRIVLAQLESYNREAYVELKEFVSRTSLNDAETFCKNLIRESPRHKGLAMRILEVRSAYVKTDFEWDNLKKLSFKMVDEANTKLMRDYVLEVSHIEDENYKT